MLIRSALTGHLDAVRRDDRAALEVAWHNACWTSFTKTLPALSEVLAQADGEEDSDDTAWHKMKVWAAAYGHAIEEDDDQSES
ncbi:hypothetical protein SAMN05518849_101541 [Sphingobium sp. AP50]|uniref:hypothetical protein n=1 Tax=Sphingobium sp. AP50 TaxID=1884369 RepID=UPI0008B7E001|nr:hypothetical protein [Sphingobium sp. AP50]SEI68180.1 hypothetical protein SAMN05518849_101541 [Sphingobium sp. AP50]